MERWRRVAILIALVLVGAACAAEPSDIPLGSADGGGVRFPVGEGGDDVATAPGRTVVRGAEDPYVLAAPAPSSPLPEIIDRIIPEETPIIDEIKPGERPPTANVCGSTNAIRTGSVVQFPWAPPCVTSASAPAHSTARGVTQYEIKIAYYVTGDPKIRQAMKQTDGCGEPDCHARYARAYAAWFNRYFETYGRRVIVEPFQGSASESDAAMAEEDAEALARGGYFAVLNGPQEAGARFAARLARRGVVCICTVSLPEDYYERHAPYVWSWLMSSTQAYIHRANYISRRLADRRAAWAGSPEMRARTRSFGLVWFDDSQGSYASGVDFFDRLLRDAGVRLAASVPYTNIQGCQARAANIVEDLLRANVTSTIFSGDPLCLTPLTQAAQARGAAWEWIVAGSILTDTNQFGRLYEQNQWRRAFGVSMLTPEVRRTNEFWARMATEIDPNEPVREDMLNVMQPFGLFFSGVHMAGPDLTADSFARGMRALPARGGTVTIPRRSFGAKTIGATAVEDFTAFDDMTEIWWDPSARDPNGGNGAYRYVDRGKRFRWDEWPATVPDVFRRSSSILGYARAPDQ